MGKAIAGVFYALSGYVEPETMLLIIGIAVVLFVGVLIAWKVEDARIDKELRRSNTVKLEVGRVEIRVDMEAPDEAHMLDRAKELQNAVNQLLKRYQGKDFGLFFEVKDVRPGSIYIDGLIFVTIVKTTVDVLKGYKSTKEGMEEAFKDLKSSIQTYLPDAWWTGGKPTNVTTCSIELVTEEQAEERLREIWEKENFKKEVLRKQRVVYEYESGTRNRSD